MRKSNRIIYFMLLIVTITACTNSTIEDTKIDIPVNNIHVNILSWDKDLSKPDRIYFRNNELLNGEIDNIKLGNRIRAWANFKAGLLDGDFIEKYPNNKLRTQKHFDNGYENGLQKGWHSNGNLSYSYNVIKGIRKGMSKEYYPNGNIQIISHFENGKEIKKKIVDLEGKSIVNYEIKEGRYYGLLGSSSCISVFNDSTYVKSYK